MEHLPNTGPCQGPRQTPKPAAARWPQALAALLLAALGTAARADESMSGLGAAFKPQTAAEAPAAARAPRAATASGLRVVVASATRSVATIDGQLVRVGDIVNGMRVTRIDQHGVLLVGEAGAREQLTINPSVVKSKRQAAATSVSNGVRQ